jgi:uncharacterized membrane-anchored protein YjiN (DUF445 family)
MKSNKSENANINFEKNNLRKRKLISTGLLIFVTISYFIFKKYRFDESGNLFYSSVVAFAEASMVGALADWFAVVALFRHPLGMKWIPHTAIVKNSKSKVSGTLSNFVVDNFFTDEKIMDIVKDVKFSKKLKEYLLQNKASISNFILKSFPKLVTEISKNHYLRELIVNTLNNTLDKLQLSELAGRTLERILKSNDNNTKLVKAGMSLTLHELEKNKETIIDFIKQQKFLGVIGIPTKVATSIYMSLFNHFQSEKQNLDNNVVSGISKVLLDKLDQIPVNLQTSDELINKIQHYKEDFIKSEDYINFTTKTIWDLIDNNVVNKIILSCERSPEKFLDKIDNFALNIISDIFHSEETCSNIDNWAHRNIESVVSANRSKIRDLISNSVNEWDEDEMVEKLELMIGSDLQYIRINGTLVGGLVGVIIHLLSYFLI